MVEQAVPYGPPLDMERICINCGMELEFVSLITDEDSCAEVLTLRCPRCRYVKKVCV
ncbi:MAG: hypothetical protein LUQ09_03170 [Methanomassiliicoccales archaeon]|nr:hypothetical protein [Methanomassiliicoccales archaeon]